MRSVRGYQFHVSSPPTSKRYQVIQNDLESVTIRAVPWKPPDTVVISEVEHGLEQELRQQIRVKVEIYSDIPTGPAGKFRLYKSELTETQAKPSASS